MSQQKLLSNKYNMALGLFPAVISLVLGTIIHPDTALYVGVTAGLAAGVYSGLCREPHLPPFLLYATTAALGLLGIAVSIVPAWSRMEAFGLIQEGVVLLLLLAVRLFHRRFLAMCRRRDAGQRPHLCVQGGEATLASIQIFLTLGLLQWLVTGVLLLFHPQPGPALRFTLFQLLPPLVPLLAIGANQLCLRYFNRSASNALFLPVVNAEGDVIGKVLLEDVEAGNREHPVPYVRIAVVHRGMPYLRLRPADSPVEPGRADLLTEGYLLFGETLEAACRRLLEASLPGVSADTLRFCTMHPYEDRHANRLVYLFTAEADDETASSAPLLRSSKPWTRQQMEQNLGKKYFSRCFEQEYEALKKAVRF